jgi:hypothetical protein
MQRTTPALPFDTKSNTFFRVLHRKSENENLQYNFHFDRLLSFPCHHSHWHHAPGFP